MPRSEGQNANDDCELLQRVLTARSAKTSTALAQLVTDMPAILTMDQDGGQFGRAQLVL
jgi:hypothetical protein